MGIVGSDIVAVTCIVAGGLLGALGWSSLDAGEGPGAAAPGCAGVVVSPVAAPDVVVRLEEGVRIVVAPRTPPGADLRIACGEGATTPEALRSRTVDARIRVVGFGGEPRSPTTLELRVPRAPASPR